MSHLRPISLFDRTSSNLASETQHAVPRSNYGTVGDTGTMLNPTAPASNYSHGLDGVDQGGNYFYANVSIATFMVLLASVLVYRAIQIGYAHIRHVVSMGRDTDQRFWERNQSMFWAKCKKHLLYAPLLNVRHNREFQLSSAISVGTLPGRFHILILTCYLFSNFIFCLALDWQAGSDEVVAQLRGRTGQLAALNIIPTVLFALRNNPLIPLTRISYDTFNLLHRWAARLVIVESVIHTICWAVNNLRSGGSSQISAGLATSVSYQWGMVATCTFSLILLLSLSPLRHAFYEAFLCGHRILVLLALIGVYIHLDRANLPQLPYIQLVFILWIAELAFRYGKILYLNISRKTGLTQITVEALPAEACRVTFVLRRPWQYTPGGHVHAYLPTLAWWSSHPFSVAWAEKASARPESMDIEMEKLANNRLTIIDEARRGSAMISRRSMMRYEAPSAESKASWSPEDAMVDRISLVCRARAGFTRQMYDRASKAPGRKFSTWGFLEGPYGGHETFASYGTVVLFAGGIGITHCAGYVHHLIQLYQAQQCATQKIVLVWSVPNTECLEWVRIWMDQILKMDGRREILRIQVFVTKPRHQGEVISSTGSVQMFPGRCVPKTIMEREVEQRIGAMAVTVCGPGAFADSVRAAVRDVVTDGCIDFIEEAFTY
ncbi:hypothetical protein AMS68_001802 [Peltaster fructicola]|uniref:FAD-binding FR-type domain-containing protein n=1 Tax=Peltaster fructicola TaxID=286661 RepID=A0A6H0XNS2_9PEZI|nr:hypothetical protein AMS68_001802 [Peltaster fructicola]